MTVTTDPNGQPLAFDPAEFASDLDLIAREVIDVAAPLTALVHPLREKYTLFFESEIPFQVIDLYQKRATRKGKRDGRLLNGLVVGNHCVRIERDGVPLLDSQEKQINFRSPELLELLRVSTAADAAQAFLGGDGYLGSMAAKVMARAGYGAEIEDGERPDPTEPA